MKWIIPAALAWLAGLCWTAWRDHLDHVHWRRMEKLRAAGPKLFPAMAAAVMPGMAAAVQAAIQLEEAAARVAQVVSAAGVRMADLFSDVEVELLCDECGDRHLDSGFTGPCMYGDPDCVEHADCGSPIVTHTHDHSEGVGPAADFDPFYDNGVWSEVDSDHDWSNPATDPHRDIRRHVRDQRWRQPPYDYVIDEEGALHRVDRGFNTSGEGPVEPVETTRHGDLYRTFSTSITADFGSRLQDERHSARDAATGMTLDELLGDIDDLIGDDDDQ